MTKHQLITAMAIVLTLMAISMGFKAYDRYAEISTAINRSMADTYEGY